MPVWLPRTFSGYKTVMIFGVRVAWSMAAIANVGSIAMGLRGYADAAKTLFAAAIVGFAAGGLRFVQARQAALCERERPRLGQRSRLGLGRAIWPGPKAGRR